MLFFEKDLFAQLGSTSHAFSAHIPDWWTFLLNWRKAMKIRNSSYPRWPFDPGSEAGFRRGWRQTSQLVDRVSKFVKLDLGELEREPRRWALPKASPSLSTYRDCVSLEQNTRCRCVELKKSFKEFPLLFVYEIPLFCWSWLQLVSFFFIYCSLSCKWLPNTSTYN